MLGFQQAFTWGEPPTFAGVNLGKVQMFLAKGTPTPSPETGAVYFLVGDADQLCEFHRSNGAEIAQAIDDRPYGIRDYTVHDLYGYHLVFGHHLYNAGPPIKIERVRARTFGEMSRGTRPRSRQTQAHECGRLL